MTNGMRINCANSLFTCSAKSSDEEFRHQLYEFVGHGRSPIHLKSVKDSSSVWTVKMVFGFLPAFEVAI